MQHTMDAAGTQRQPLGQAEINWDKLDKTKFYFVGAGIFSGVTVALFPITVVKTRLQVASHSAAERSAISVVKGILKADGIPGLYRGFGTVVTGAIPTRALYLTALETTKVAALNVMEPIKMSEPTRAAVANGVAGMLASVCSQTVFVPVDVSTINGARMFWPHKGGLDVVRNIVKAEGIRGLYRGFGLSVATFSPSSGVWWASYGASQRFIWRLVDDGIAPPSQGKIMLVQAAGGVFAGATAACITNPVDTIKTRLQVMKHETRPTARQVIRKLIADDGWTGLYRGLGPRFFSMSAWGTSMILAYEYLKRLCAKDE